MDSLLFLGVFAFGLAVGVRCGRRAERQVRERELEQEQVTGYCEFTKDGKQSEVEVLLIEGGRYEMLEPELYGLVSGKEAWERRN